MGAQTLINLGVPNKVYALENGTQGWYLADLPLEHQSDRLYPPSIQDKDLPILQQRSAAIAARYNVQAVDAAQVQQWLAQTDRTTFLCDVRTPEEFTQTNLPAGVQHTPGGQLIQATDEYVGVRKSRLVLLDFDGVRAPVVASWLRQLGWEVYLLNHPQNLQIAAPAASPRPVLRHTTVLVGDQIASFVAAHPEAKMIDTRPSMQFRQLRLQGSRWALRPTMATVVPDDKDTAILLIGEHPGKLQILAADLECAGHTAIYCACMDNEQIRHSGLAVDTDQAELPDEQCIDFLFFVHDRHQGNKEAARQYLEWETNLISQIDDLERQTFSFA